MKKAIKYWRIAVWLTAGVWLLSFLGWESTVTFAAMWLFIYPLLRIYMKPPKSDKPKGGILHEFKATG